jgi:hypothetical protein
MRFPIGVAYALAFATLLPAANIITISDSDPDTPGQANITGGSSSLNGQAFAVSWTQSQDFSNVTIRAAIAFGTAGAPGNSLIQVFLNQTAGLPTTNATQILTNVLSVPDNPANTPAPLMTLFAGHPLAAGTYFLSVFYLAGGTPSWDFENPFSQSSDVGATLNGSGFYRSSGALNASYLPNSTFTLQSFGPGFFEVTGDSDSSVPEPSTFALLGLGIAAITLRRRSS